MPRARTTRTGTVAKFSIMALLLIVVVAALLELRSGGGPEVELAAYARANPLDPLDVVEVAGRSRRLLFVADVPSAAAPKRFVAQAIERLAAGPGLDLVVLEVDAAEQPHIDRYLATVPEDASILLSRPRALREDDAASRSYLDIYRTVWRVNQQLGAHRRIRIVAADAPGWPPVRATSLHDAARAWGERDAHMLDAVTQRSLAREPGARVLFFLSGLHALKRGGGRLQTGGTRPVEVQWLAARLAQRYPQDVYTILVDASPMRVIATDVATYRGTRAADALRRGGVPTGSAFRLDDRFDALSRTPIRVVTTTGLDFTLEPRTAALSELADAYVYYGH